MRTFYYKTFTWDGIKMLFTEAATLGLRPGESLKRFFVQGKKQTVEFVLTSRDTDSDGDIVSWSYVPVRSDLYVMVKIFND